MADTELLERLDKLTGQLELLVQCQTCQMRKECTREKQYERLLREVIVELEQTRQHFKSRQLYQLRQRLEKALEE